jgi:hypothetical protein
LPSYGPRASAASCIAFLITPHAGAVFLQNAAHDRASATRQWLRMIRAPDSAESAANFYTHPVTGFELMSG